eukprot:gene2267-2604_t
MDIYKRALKLQNMQHINKELVLCPGAFHTSICALRCLGKTIEGSGLDEAWIEAGLYGSVTTNQIINGNHYGRALEAHEITLQVLYEIWIKAFFKERPAVHDALKSGVIKLSDACFSKEGVWDAHHKLMVTLESLNLSKQLESFDQVHNANPVFQWARQHDSAQNISEYIARMSQLKTDDPQTWDKFMAGDFTVSASNQVPFTRLGVDQAQEHVNKKLKGQGAVNGITQSSSILLKFCLCAPELARISGEIENTVESSGHKKKQQHHCLNTPALEREEKAIEKLHKVLMPCQIFQAKEV